MKRGEISRYFFLGDVHKTFLKVPTKLSHFRRKDKVESVIYGSVIAWNAKPHIPFSFGSNPLPPQ